MWPVQSNAARDGEQCGQQCIFAPSPFNGEAGTLAGPCGCIAEQSGCSSEFSGGIVRELCEGMGSKNFGTAYSDSGAMEDTAVNGARRLLGSEEGSLSLLASAE